MCHLTKTAAIENATAIWEYDPTLDNSHVLGGSLDVIAAIQTLVIKIQVSGQHVEYFNTCQVQCDIATPLKIPLHSNVRWGTAYGMLDRAYHLCEVHLIFFSSFLHADLSFIGYWPFHHLSWSTLQPYHHYPSERLPVKHIWWSAFQLSDADWECVLDARNILAVCSHVQLLISQAKSIC